MTAARASAREVHLARVEASARYLCAELDRPWEEAEKATQDGWRWIAEQTLHAADTARGRGVRRTPRKATT